MPSESFTLDLPDIAGGLVMEHGRLSVECGARDQRDMVNPHAVGVELSGEDVHASPSLR